MNTCTTEFEDNSVIKSNFNNLGKEIEQFYFCITKDSTRPQTTDSETRWIKRVFNIIAASLMVR